MKIAIHQRKGSFSDYWIPYCKKHDISFKIVNCYETNIIQQLDDCGALMWHHHHQNYKDILFAKELLFALEQSGVKVFPNFNTAWHFDDKVGQKYFLEAIKAPLVPSYVFYDKKNALKWVESTTFPKVFKLRGGAGSSNVKLVRNGKDAAQKVNLAFGRGFSKYDRMSRFKDAFSKWRNKNASISKVLKATGRLFIPTKFAKMRGREKGYVYFQKFIPNNDSDTRVIVVGNKAFAVKRMVRKGDFRASGSGVKKYQQEEIDLRCVRLAFELNKKIKSQSIAYDFIFNEKNNPLLVEISYGFAINFYDSCPGYWDQNLNFHKTIIDPYGWMVEELIDSIN